MAASDTRSIARAVRLGLTDDIFTPATSRLLWLPVHLLIIAAGIAFSVSFLEQGGSALALLPVSLVLGMSFAGLAFVAHETLHGALTRNRALRRVVGFVGFLPFWVSPRLWIAWHNRVHHGNTNIDGKDPDAYPSLAEYKTNRAARLAVQIGAPRSRKLRGIITLILGFTLQSAQVLAFAKQRGYLSPRHYVLALLETTLGITLWVSLGVLVGAEVFLFVYVLPLMVGNAIVMAHIITNHSLSPLCDENDALETSLTVTVPRWFEFYSLGFGYHVEHHLYPGMSNRYAPLVRDKLRQVAADRYQEMPLTRALYQMWITPRVYEDDFTLLDPETGQRVPTLGARGRRPMTVFTPPQVPEVSAVAVSAGDLPENAAWDVIPQVLPAPVSARPSSIPPPPAA
jgi:fatty acid desaturase